MQNITDVMQSILRLAKLGTPFIILMMSLLFILLILLFVTLARLNMLRSTFRGIGNVILLPVRLLLWVVGLLLPRRLRGGYND